MTLVVETPSSYLREREYIVGVLFSEFLGLGARVQPSERPDVRITCSDAGGELILADRLFGTPDDAWLTFRSLPSRPLPRWNVRAFLRDALVTEPVLPVLYGDDGQTESLLRETPGGLSLGLDVLGGSFFLLTRYEELVGRDRDRHDRFPASSALAVQEDFVGRPVVNEYTEILWATLRRLWPRLERKPRAHRVLVSHDVDWPFCSEAALRRLMSTTLGDGLLRREKAALALDRVNVRRRTDLCDTFDFIMDESERRNLKSAFYFLAGRSAAGIDGSYSLDDPRLRRLLRRIHERGHEIGLHPSYHTFRDGERMRREFAVLRRACAEEGIDQETWGGRQHYLRWENPTTWRNWAQAGLAYDSTLSFAETPGFRCGTCFEYPVFDLVQRKPLALRERPLVAMEVSLLVYRGLRPAAVGAELATLRERCRLFGGDFTLLWHNSRLITRTDRRLYREALGAPQATERVPVRD